MRYSGICFLLLIVVGLASEADLRAQNVSRSNGIGLQLSYWNMRDRSLRFSFAERNSTFDVNGVGAWLNYFSRISPQWYLDFSLGAFASIRGEDTGAGVEASTEILTVVPFVLGLRYHLLPARLTSSFQPYLKAGLGPYWTSAFHTAGDTTGAEAYFEGKLQAGACLGGGVNFILTSWSALNLELKYQFVDVKLASENGLHLSSSRIFSGLEFALGVSFMWGRKPEMMRIKGLTLLVTDIYPAYAPFYGTYPLAQVTVQNVAGYPIDVNVQSFVRGYSERPKDSGFMHLEKGETKDIPVTAIFGSRLREAKQRQAAVMDLKVEARAGGVAQKEISTSIIVHSYNAWNGEIDHLSFFVTPEDEHVLALARACTRRTTMNDHATGNLPVARAIMDSLAHTHIRYQRDPNIPFYKDDRVQFARETLALGSGDCDDLSVLLVSLLESAGINAAFVDVQDPEKSVAHLYVLFDTGVPAEQGEAISSNSKRYVIRENIRGQHTLWIPVETTVLAQGFEAAWQAGALQYLQNGVVRNGLAQGWVRVVEVE
ncbi:MAG: transglutaminase domain-containing protein [bacterium]